MSSTYFCAVSVTEMDIGGVRLSKEMTPQTTTVCCGSVWRAIVRNRISLLPWTSPNTYVVVLRTQLVRGLLTKDYTSPVSAVFHVDRAWHP
ncbi:hypothetical protein TNCV_3113941 [Trichonephila clavipes]|nr:hypothetical protein TNCV_3113941 [Trichonephila clavipes]